jgi:DNA-directed RNA polymerase subunit RPC12/RpoP
MTSNPGARPNLLGIMRRMADSTRPTPLPLPPPSPSRHAPPADDPVVCERCGAKMFRMHAVWRCPACGYKTDCCGW